jgi:hypothetical protein
MPSRRQLRSSQVAEPRRTPEKAVQPDGASLLGRAPKPSHGRRPGRPSTLRRPLARRRMGFQDLRCPEWIAAPQDLTRIPRLRWFMPSRRSPAEAWQWTLAIAMTRSARSCYTRVCRSAILPPPSDAGRSFTPGKDEFARPRQIASGSRVQVPFSHTTPPEPVAGISLIAAVAGLASSFLFAGFSAGSTGGGPALRPADCHRRRDPPLRPGKILTAVANLKNNAVSSGVSAGWNGWPRWKGNTLDFHISGWRRATPSPCA